MEYFVEINVSRASFVLGDFNRINCIRHATAQKNGDNFKTRFLDSLIGLSTDWGLRLGNPFFPMIESDHSTVLSSLLLKTINMGQLICFYIPDT